MSFLVLHPTQYCDLKTLTFIQLHSTSEIFRSILDSLPLVWQAQLNVLDCAKQKEEADPVN